MADILGYWLAPVLERRTAPPGGSPTNGDRYLVIAAAAPPWAGKAGYIAEYENSAWVFFLAKVGSKVNVTAEPNFTYVQNSSLTWTPDGISAGLTGLQFQINDGATGIAVRTGNLELGLTGLSAQAVLTTGNQSISGTKTFTTAKSQSVSLGATGSTIPVDWSTSNLFLISGVTGPSTMNFSNHTNGQSITSIITSTGATGIGGYTGISLWTAGGGSTGIKWAGGAPHSQTSPGTDVVSFVMINGVIYGSWGADFK